MIISDLSYLEVIPKTPITGGVYFEAGKLSFLSTSPDSIFPYLDSVLSDLQQMFVKATNFNFENGNGVFAAAKMESSSQPGLETSWVAVGEIKGKEIIVSDFSLFGLDG